MSIINGWLCANCRVVSVLTVVAVAFFGSAALATEGSGNSDSCIEDAMIVFDAWALSRSPAAIRENVSGPNP